LAKSNAPPHAAACVLTHNLALGSSAKSSSTTSAYLHARNGLRSWNRLERTELDELSRGCCDGLLSGGGRFEPTCLTSLWTMPAPLMASWRHKLRWAIIFPALPRPLCVSPSGEAMYSAGSRPLWTARATVLSLPSTPGQCSIWPVHPVICERSSCILDAAAAAFIDITNPHV